MSHLTARTSRPPGRSASHPAGRSLAVPALPSGAVIAPIPAPVTAPVTPPVAAPVPVPRRLSLVPTVPVPAAVARPVSPDTGATDEDGSLVAEYGLLAVVAATVAGVLISWATSGALASFFGQLLQHARSLVVS